MAPSETGCESTKPHSSFNPHVRSSVWNACQVPVLTGAAAFLTSSRQIALFCPIGVLCLLSIFLPRPQRVTSNVPNARAERVPAAVRPKHLVRHKPRLVDHRL